MENIYHIGRDREKNEIYITESTISSSHAQIFFNKNLDLTLIDLSSKNGVFVNNNKIKEPTKIEDKDVISFGKFTCTKEDILTAVKLFESNKRRGVVVSVPLILTNQKNNFSDIPKKRKSNKKTIIVTLSTVLGIIIFFLAFFIIPRKKDNNTNTNVVKSDKQSTDVVYDFSCMNSESNQVLTPLGDIARQIEDELLNEMDLSIEDEENMADNEIDSARAAGQVYLISSGNDYDKIKKIMNDLVSRLANPKGYDYEIFLIDDPLENAFTIGGNIYFFKGMLDFCKNDSEIALIIGHEIAHNELGHTTQLRKKMILSKEIDAEEEFYFLDNFVFGGFNQKQEVECDLFGLDILFPTDHEVCDAISLWERFGAERDKGMLDSFFSTHPYSDDRETCLKHHYKNNYNMSCD